MRVYRSLCAVIVGIMGFWSSIEAQQSVQHSIRDAAGHVSCVVSIPAIASGARVADPLTVDVRVPAPPDSTLLEKLPPSRRNYKNLPLGIFLVPAPPKGQTVAAAPAARLPLSKDLVERRLGVSTNPDLDTFVRAVFQRGALTEELDLVAEKTAITNSGEQITTQTRCRITAADAAVWR